jgi:hypothetical protein
LTADNSVFLYSNANDMHVTQDLNSLGEIIAHAHCSIDEEIGAIILLWYTRNIFLLASDIFFIN